MCEVVKEELHQIEGDFGKNDKRSSESRKIKKEVLHETPNNSSCESIGVSVKKSDRTLKHTNNENSIEEIVLISPVKDMCYKKENKASSFKDEVDSVDLSDSLHMLSSLCRICGNDCGDKVSHFIFSSEGEELNILEKITRCLPILVMELDELPHCICSNCLQKLNESYNLIITAVETEKKLRSYKQSEVECVTNNNKFVSEDVPAEKIIINISTHYNMFTASSNKTSTIKNDSSFFVEAQSTWCDICDVKFSGVNLLCDHVEKDHMDNKTLQCPICHSKVNGPDAFLVHKIDKHILNFLSYYCNNLTEDLDDSEEDVIMIKCPSCNEDISENVAYKYGMVECSDCGQHFVDAQSFCEHKMSHVFKMMICILCKEVFYNTHVHEENQAMNGQLYSCKICKTSFPDNEKLNTHKYNVCSMKLYQCELCGRRYTHNNNLIRHYKTCLMKSKSIGIHRCGHCEKSYVLKCDLSRHIRKEHTPQAKKQEWVCRFCSKHLATRYGLIDHERIHTQERPFVCDKCGKSFYSNASLQQHALIHSGIRKHACTVCHKYFQRKSHVRLHMRTHTGEKPFVCDVCGCTFTQIGDMRRHQNRHFS